MPKLKSERIIIYEKDENGHDIRDDRDEKGRWKSALDFSIDINVAQGGEFTTTLPADVVDKLKEAKIDLRTNGKRGSREGFFAAPTLSELLKKVNAVANEYVSKKLISERIIIRYIIETVCRYGINSKGEFAPYAAYFGNKEKYREGEGTVMIHAASPGTYGFRVWSEVVKRRTYLYASGKERQFDDFISGSHDVKDDKPMLKYLSSIYCQKQARGEVQEMDYTEDTAKFFVDLYRAIFMINEKIKNNITPDAIQLIIENKQKLLS